MGQVSSFTQNHFMGGPFAHSVLFSACYHPRQHSKGQFSFYLSSLTLTTYNLAGSQFYYTIYIKKQKHLE